MNKILALIITLCTASVSFGQISFDLRLELANPVSGSTVSGTSSVLIDFTLINQGPDTIPAGDTLFFIYSDICILFRNMGANIRIKQKRNDRLYC